LKLVENDYTGKAKTMQFTISSCKFQANKIMDAQNVKFCFNLNSRRCSATVAAAANDDDYDDVGLRCVV